MTLDRLEGWARWAGAVGALVFVGLVYAGVWGGSSRAIGRVSGRPPAGLWSVWFYGPASVLGLWLLRLLWRPLPLRLWRAARAGALVLGSLLYFPGLGLMTWGRLALGEMYNVSSSLGVRLYAEHRLVTSGPFALVRHPMYVGGTLAELGALLLYRTWATLLIAVLNPPILAVRARREEEALAAEFGQQWTAYCRRVPACIPRLGG